MQILSITFWKAIWIWCKVNWKFLVGFGIPIVIGIILRKNNQTKILKNALEFRKEQMKIEKEAAGIAENISQEAIQTHLERSQEIRDDHNSELKKIKEETSEKLNDLDTADKVTKEINRRLNDE